MAGERKTWRGKRVAPRTPGEAWGAFVRETGFALVIVLGIAVVALMVASGEATLNPRNRWDYLWIKVVAAGIIPLILAYEGWLLWQRLSAFRRGEVFVDVDEHSPDAVPPPSRSKRRETPAQKKRRKEFWRNLVIITAIWLFCTVAVGVLVVDDWLKGRPFGETGVFFLGLLVMYLVIVVLSVKEKRDKDRGL